MCERSGLYCAEQFVCVRGYRWAPFFIYIMYIGIVCRLRPAHNLFFPTLYLYISFFRFFLSFRTYGGTKFISFFRFFFFSYQSYTRPTFHFFLFSSLGACRKRVARMFYRLSRTEQVKRSVRIGAHCYACRDGVKRFVALCLLKRQQK